MSQAHSPSGGQAMSDAKASETATDSGTLAAPGQAADPSPDPIIEVVYSAEMIEQRIAALAAEIAAARLDDLLVVAILKGSFVFAADLIRAMHAIGMAPQVEFLSLASYRAGTTSSGRVEIVRDIDLDLGGRNVLVIDDILESGRTLAFARHYIEARGAASVRTCVLLDKPVERAGIAAADFRAFACPPLFVVGYGMDLAYRYRQLPFVGHIVRRAQSAAGDETRSNLSDNQQGDDAISS